MEKVILDLVVLTLIYFGHSLHKNQVQIFKSLIDRDKCVLLDCFRSVIIFNSYSQPHSDVVHICYCFDSTHKSLRWCECHLRVLMVLRFIGLVGMELDWIWDRHCVGRISSAFVAIWCPTGAFRWAKYKFDSSSSLKQIMLKWEQAVRLCHRPPSFPLSSSLTLLWLTGSPLCSCHQ